MIVTSQNVLLTPGLLDLNAPIFGWHSLINLSNIVADSENIDYPSSNLANVATVFRWLSASTATQYLTADVSNDEPVDYVGLARHNLGSTLCQVSVEALIGGIWVEVFAPVLLGTDSPHVLRFAVTYADKFRVKLVPAGVMPTIAILYLGKLLVAECRIYVGHTPLPYGKSTENTTGIAESGDYLGRIVTRRRLGTTVNLKNLTPGWYRTQMQPFIDVTEDTPFFFGWRPLTYPREVGYAWVTNDPQPQNQLQNGMMQITLQLGGLIL